MTKAHPLGTHNSPRQNCIQSRTAASCTAYNAAAYLQLGMRSKPAWLEVDVA